MLGPTAATAAGSAVAVPEPRNHCSGSPAPPSPIVAVVYAAAAAAVALYELLVAAAPPPYNLALGADFVF